MPLFLLQGLDLTVPASATSELAAAFLQTAITLGLVLVCAFLYQRYFGWLALAWALYAVRLGAILSFVLMSAPVWLYWHQVITGWTALALLWAALVFSQGLRSTGWTTSCWPPDPRCCSSAWRRCGPAGCSCGTTSW
jgi:hypothetical protein